MGLVVLKNVYYLVALGWISSSWFCGAKNDKGQNASILHVSTCHWTPFQQTKKACHWTCKKKKKKLSPIRIYVF